MKSYVEVFNEEGHVIENFITHYATLKGFLRYGVKNWVKKPNAASFTFSVYADSSQLYSGNFISMEKHYLNQN